MKETEKRELEKELQKEKKLPIPVEEILEQIEIFKNGIPYIKLYKPCLVGEGIKVISDDKQQEYISLFTDALEKKDILKFVPASGAATRMFKKQLAVLLDDPEIDVKRLKLSVSKGDEESLATLDFFENLNRFAFYGELKNFSNKNGYDLEELIGNGEVADVVRLVATEEGLNYSNLPKGSILFHYYPGGSRTAFEEHLIEAMNSVANKEGEVRIHFTISPEHENDVRQLFNSLVEKHTAQNWIFQIDFSFQSSSTDTISVTSDNMPFKDEDGKIVFRPGGHGALLKNLNDIQADIILIKNIDNVVQEYLSSDTYKYKKILGGYLISLQEKVFNLLTEWDNLKSDNQSINGIINFINEEFDINLTERLNSKSLTDKKKFLFDFLNRPIRVCGMVKKEGHPGGGPFFVTDDKGNISKQVVETVQIDLSDKEQKKILDAATHFSPVDFVCGVKDYLGNNFDLQKYSNSNTGLITKKSKDGKELKALELPGLWNGGMYYWLTVFVEVPKVTFNPVKEINDLLKPEHQPENF